MRKPIHIGIPAYCERESLPETLTSLANSDCAEFEAWVCVNQPAEYLHDPQFQDITKENLDTLAWLKHHKDAFPFRLHILDAVEENAVPGGGVGQARRLVFDRILEDHNPWEVFISLDADTLVDPHYVSRVQEAFARFPNAVGLAAPVYHLVPQDPDHALRLLRYELYIRYFQLSLWRIGSPYAFLAIGSAMAFRPQSYQRIGGMPRRKAGEDFYFMQQLRKIGPIIRWIPARVYPSSRESDRVPFGTGPLMMEPDLSLQETRFPFYSQDFFQNLHDTFQAFPSLHKGDLQLPIHSFLEERLGGYEAFRKMRRNFSKPDQFIKACHERIDGLRTLQYLRFSEDNLKSSLNPQTSVNQLLALLGKPSLALEFSKEKIPELDQARNLLVQYEAEFQQNFMEHWSPKAKW